MDARSNNDNDLREQALKRLKKKSEFMAHLLAYLTVNGLLIAIWAATGSGYFWPVFPLAGWGIGIVLHAWDVYKGEPTEAEISREMERLAKR